MGLYRDLVHAIDEVTVLRVRAKKRVPWGQSVQLADLGPIAGDFEDGTIGYLEPGDMVQIRTGVEPTNGGAIRVRVETHDGRKVGNSRQLVWIHWPGEKEGREMFEVLDWESMDGVTVYAHGGKWEFSYLGEDE